MPKLTKSQFEEMFREEVMPYLVEHERTGFPDKPRRREAWNNTVDAYIRDGALPEAAGNWSHPRWLETWSPRQHSHATRKSPAQLDREIAEALAAQSGSAKFPVSHAKRASPRSAWPSVVGSHDLGTADVRTEQGAYWIVTKPTGYRVDYKPWGPSNDVELGTFPSRKRAREKIAEHALSVGATVRHHATKKAPRRGAPKFQKFSESHKDDWFPLWKFREMIVDGRIFDEDGSGRYGKLDDRGQKVVSNVKVDLGRFATPHSFDRHVPSWATGVVWSSSRPHIAHATRGRGSKKEVTYRGYTYNLRSAYDRGYYDALRGMRAQEQDPDYATGYASGQHAPYLRR